MDLQALSRLPLPAGYTGRLPTQMRLLYRGPLAAAGNFSGCNYSWECNIATLVAGRAEASPYTNCSILWKSVPKISANEYTG